MPLNWSGYRTAAWIGLAFLLLAAGVAWFQEKQMGALTLLGFLAAGVAFIRLDARLPTLFDLLFVVAGLLNAAGYVWDWFAQPGAYDEVAHAYTTFAGTLAIGYLIYGSRLIRFGDRQVLIVLTIASFGVALGALWEVVEWLADIVVEAQVIESLDDTVTDLIMDALGALLAAGLSLVAVRSEARSQAEQR